jgi:chromosome segregation ATPase
LDERDVTHKTEVEKLKSRIAELLDEKEERDGQLKKVQGLLATSEADAAEARTELQHLKEQATKWEVATSTSISPVSFKSSSARHTLSDT